MIFSENTFPDRALRGAPIARRAIHDRRRPSRVILLRLHRHHSIKDMTATQNVNELLTIGAQDQRRRDSRSARHLDSLFFDRSSFGQRARLVGALWSASCLGVSLIRIYFQRLCQQSARP